MIEDKIKLGLFGLGHLGKIHLKCLLELDIIQLVGCFDVSAEMARGVCEEAGVRFYEDPDDLIRDCQAIDVVTPTITHFDIASRVISQGRHCFIEKPVTSSVREAEELLSMALTSGVKVQIGHVERYNPGFLSVKDSIRNPRFIEAHRLSTFNPRGTDVSVVHDLMIHDLDLISVIARSEPIEVRAKGVNIVSPTADICNARIEFKNGLVANVTASRISMKQMRKLRIFQDDAYISLDLLTKESQVISLLDQPQEQTLEIDTYRGKKYISLYNPDVQPVNAIKTELSAFASSILSGEETEVSLDDGIRALRLVEIISAQIENSKDETH